MLRPVKLPRRSPQPLPTRLEQENLRNLLPRPAPGSTSAGLRRDFHGLHPGRRLIDELVSLWVFQGIVANAGELKAEQNARGSTVRRTLVSRNHSLPNSGSRLNLKSSRNWFRLVFRARIVGKVYRGEETRYDVQVIHSYRNSFRLEHREFIWAPNLCDCPRLETGKQYILMVRRHVNYERTLNRILLEEASYVAAYRPREDQLLRQHERLCGNRGEKVAEQL